MSDLTAPAPASEHFDNGAAETEISMLDLLIALVKSTAFLLLASLGFGVVALGLTYLVTPVFTARTVVLPPTQQQSASASVLASLGSLAGIAGSAVNVKSPADQYVSLMQSATVSDRLIERFGLMDVYAVSLRQDARNILAAKVRITIGKKDGLLTIDVDDTDPKRAADLANQYVEELRRSTSQLAITEPQQRRAFFEQQLTTTRGLLDKAQLALQASGFNADALKAEPKAAAERSVRLQIELSNAELQLQMLGSSLADSAPEIRQQRALVEGLRRRMSSASSAATPQGNTDYIGAYRDYKYQETMFDFYSRQFESARLDEAREGVVIQVVDRAEMPEKRSSPKRGATAIVVTIVSFLLLTAGTVLRHLWREASRNPPTARKLAALRAAGLGLLPWHWFDRRPNDSHH